MPNGDIMNFTQLKYALEIEKTRSITKAAQNLYMSQPNLSKAVKELEGEIGTKIFLRSAKGVEITKNGVEFLAYARTIVAQMEALEAIYKPHTSETLSLNFCMPRATYISIAFTDFLNQIGPENHISINLRERNSQDTINYVADGEADFGVIRVQEAYESYFFYTLKEKGLDYRILLEYHPLVLFSKDSPLAAYSSIHNSMLEGYTEILHGDIALHTAYPAEHAKKAQIPDRRIYVYERGSQFDILQNVKNTYMWVSPIPKAVLTSHSLVEKKSLSPTMLYKDLLIYKKEHIFQTHETMLLSCIEHVITEKLKDI